MGSLRAFFAAFPRMVQGELRGLRNLLLRLAGALCFLFLFQLTMDSYIFSSVVGIVLWIFSFLWIVNIRRITNMAIVGEAFEALHITPITPAERSAEGAAAIVVNPLNDLFWRVSLQLFFFMTVAALVVPLLPLRNNPALVFLFPLMLVASAIAFRGAVLITANILSGIFIAGLIMFHCGMLFLPQILLIFPSFATEYVAKFRTGNLAGRNASELGEIVTIRERQRQEMVAEAMGKARRWQEQNRGKPLPVEIERDIEAAKQGLSLAELQARLKAEADAKAKAEAEAKAKAEKAEAEAKAKAQAEAKALELRRQAEKLEAEKNKIKTISNGYVLRPADGGVVCLTMQAGDWNVFPANTRMKEAGDKIPRETGGEMFVSRETTSCFFPSPGTREIVLTKK